MYSLLGVSGFAGLDHKPPSSDGLARQPAQPRQPGQRPKGGQPGHKGHSLVMHPTPDHVEYYGVAGHCDCGLPLTAALIETGECRQQWDIPEKQIVVTEHRQLICTCGCGKKVSSLQHSRLTSATAHV
ncbi:MAG: hypothetical protein WBM66_06105 [Thiothrix litoralis]